MVTPHTGARTDPPADDRFRRAGGLTVLHWPVLDALGLEAVVTTRHGGVSGGPFNSLNLGMGVGDRSDAVIENRRRAAHSLGAELEDLVFADQVHGRVATVVDRRARGRGVHDAADAVASSDALVTAETGIVLVTLVADCVPIVLFDPDARVLATVHAGWRGTVARAAAAAVEAMAAHGARPGAMVAGLGPAVSPTTYEVGPEVSAAFESCFGDRTADERITVKASPRTWLVDLVRANRLVLLDAGLRPEAVHHCGVTTGSGGPFFSDRAARPCGRFGLLARIGE